MSERTAKTIVLLVGAMMCAAVFARRSTIKDPFRFAWAAGVITLGLSVLADIAPEIAGPFALLVLLAVWYRNKAALAPLAPSAPAPATGGTK